MAAQHSATVRVNLDELVEKMQTPKPDGLSVIMRENGTFTAICKRCQMRLQVGETNYEGMPLVWHRCTKCERVSFSVEENLKRDARIAQDMGGIFLYEVYFMKDLPPQLAPPKEWRKE